ncbi:BnaC04g55210D [Brassica napus]|uniref:BnaC04g55210D protein n=1 Tax=Brassica napus TaxID=3708 RepID=A0A078II18_BRANA|nr:BnaC04g55210D [Brassica napus]
MSKRESKDSTAEPLHQRFYPLNREEALASQVTRFFNSLNTLPLYPYSNMELFGKLGLHYYYLHKGTDLKLLTVHKFKTSITSIFYNIRGNRSMKLQRSAVQRQG